MENKTIRAAAKAASVSLWEVADALGVSEATMTRWLRFRLSTERECLVLDAIKRLAAEKGAANDADS